MFIPKNRAEFSAFSLLCGVLLCVAQFIGNTAWAGLGQYVLHTRYYGHGGFNSNTAVKYKLNSDGTYSGHNSSIVHSKVVNSCEYLLNEQQRFPMDMMVKTGYVPEDEASDRILAAAKFYPGQINFFEMMTGDKFVNGENIDAAMWTVSGQVWFDPNKPASILPLPWQRMRHLKNLAQRLDRNKYKYIFEWGRAAQTEKGQIDILLSYGAASNYRELRALGGELNDAFVMFHAGDQMHTDIYLKRHPGRQWEKDAPEFKPGESLFLVPLSEMLAADKYPPSLASGEVKELLKLSKGELSELQILEFFNEINLAHWRELDTRYPEIKEAPIVLHDWTTKLKPQRLLLKLDRLGLSYENAAAVVNYVSKYVPELHSANVGQYRDVTDAFTAHQNIAGHEVIEISNLEVESAKKDPKYVAANLMAALGYEARDISQYLEPVPGASPMELGVGFFHAQKIEFAISTFDQELAKEIEKLKPSAIRSFKNPGDSAPTDIFGFQPWVMDAHSKEMKTFIFSVERIDEIRKEMNLDVRIFFMFNSGGWNAHRRLSDFSLF